jgi:hypothetical protein
MPTIRGQTFQSNISASAPKYALATLIQSFALAVLHHLFQQAPHGLYSVHQTVEFSEFSLGKRAPPL